MKKIIPILILLLIVVSGCSNNSSNKNLENKTIETSRTEDTIDLYGKWQFNGTIDEVNYDVELELEKNGDFTLDVIEENETESIDSELTGTYVIDDNIIILSVITVQDEKGYFNNEVVQNGQVELDYSLKDDRLVLNNANSTINVVPTNLELTRVD